MPRTHPATRLRPLLGLGLVGYGLLVTLGVIAHEAAAAGVLSLVTGAVLLVPGLPALGVGRGPMVASIGVAAAGGVLVYNLIVGFHLGLPEAGLLAYGVLLVAAAGRLERRVGRTDVATLVGWSFPLVLAPLLLFAINALLSGPPGAGAGSAAQPVIIHALVIPMAACLTMFGTPAEVVRDNVVLETSTGTLSLGVGLVCAGLYPMVLFLGVLGLHAWKADLSRRRIAAYLAAGLVGLYVVNILRLVLVAKVGHMYGGQALQTVHAHLGWVLFGVFMVAFWAIVLRGLEGRAAAPAASTRPSDDTSGEL